MTSQTSGGFIKSSFTVDGDLLADLEAAANERRISRSVVMREWLRLGRDEERRRQDLLRRDREQREASGAA